MFTIHDGGRNHLWLHVSVRPLIKTTVLVLQWRIYIIIIILLKHFFFFLWILIRQSNTTGPFYIWKVRTSTSVSSNWFFETSQGKRNDRYLTYNGGKQLFPRHYRFLNKLLRVLHCLGCPGKRLTFCTF